MDRGAWQAYSPWSHKESDMTEQHFHFLVQNSLRMYFWDIFEGSNKQYPQKRPKKKKKGIETRVEINE